MKMAVVRWGRPMSSPIGTIEVVFGSLCGTVMLTCAGITR